MTSAQYDEDAATPELDELDFALLVILSEHKILSTYQLTVLFFDSLRTAQKRIKGLKEAGLICTLAWRNRRTHRESDRHFLSAAGAQTVCRYLEVTRAQLGWIPTDTRDARKRLWHISGANAFFCELIEGTLDTSDVGLLRWRPEHQIRTAGSWIQPDGFGRLLHPGGVSEFFFEFDRATENRGPLIAKFTRYLRVASSWPKGPKTFPSVLVLVPDEDREMKLRELLAEAATNVEPEAAVITSRFYSSNLELLKALGPLGEVWRPILIGTDRIVVTALPVVLQTSHATRESLRRSLEGCLGRRWCKGAGIE
jgi:hypothetical protein